jgi:NAD+ synthase (glutamine-hydrolysing)
MAKNKITIAIAQLDFLVGDIAGNTEKIINYASKARDELQADIVVFPELALSGYPPEDLLLRTDLYKQVNKALNLVRQTVTGIYILLGYPQLAKGKRYNSAALIYHKKVIATYQKQHLPNYGVFDEQRYFQAGSKPCVVKIFNTNVAISICEDIWFADVMQQAKRAGAKMMLTLNSSPFDMYKPSLREQIIAKRAKEGKMPLVYVNCVGGQDELVFDGGSMVLDAKGKVTQSVGFFAEKLMVAEFVLVGSEVIPKPQPILPVLSVEERVYTALVVGVRDYIEKNHFKGAVIGMSGGIDSALTLAVAVDAIGSARVKAVMMPSRYTRKMSVTDAIKCSAMLGVKCSEISIEPMFQATLTSLAAEFKGLPTDTTEENIQARCRGILLMALSNKEGLIVLSTGNKSEMAVGYSTLYGDMVGGFCVLKDVPKTWVYRLVDYRNKISLVIPKRIITRPPSAELAPGQVDQDSLPPYEVLDAILERYVENDQSLAEIVAAGFAEKEVKKVLTMINRNEYKRRQAPPGVRVTARAFGRDRRYPITSGYDL